MPETKKFSQDKDDTCKSNNKCHCKATHEKCKCNDKDKHCCKKDKCKCKPSAKEQVTEARTATPKLTPKLTPKATPKLTPKATPKATPKLTPKATPTPPPAPKPKPPLIGTMTYELTPEAQNSPLRSEIVDGMDDAVDTYNRYAKFNTHITAHYDSNVPTAEASGTIRVDGRIPRVAARNRTRSRRRDSWWVVVFEGSRVGRDGLGRSARHRENPGVRWAWRGSSRRWSPLLELRFKLARGFDARC